MPNYRAVIGAELGPPENYAVERIARRPLGDAEVRVAVAAAGVSYVDVLVARGEYQVRPPVPYTPSLEFAGTIVEVGAAVSGYAIGDEVACGAMGGGFAEEAIVDAGRMIRLPDMLDFVEAASAYLGYQTAYHGLVQRACIAPGETMLVLGAAGAVSTAMIEMGRVLGATVIASASTPAKREAATRHGATLAIDSRAEDWRDQVREATGARGVDVVVDPVGAEETERAFRSLAWNGRHLVIGFAGGPMPALKTNLPLLKGGALVGVDIRQFRKREPEKAAANIEAINGLLASGKLVPQVSRVFSFADYREAMHHAVSRDRIGRTVLRIG